MNRLENRLQKVRTENASPSIAAQDVFKEYEKTGDFETVISNLADTFNEAIQGFEMTNIKNGLY